MGLYFLSVEKVPKSVGRCLAGKAGHFALRNRIDSVSRLRVNFSLPAAGFICNGFRARNAEAHPRRLKIMAIRNKKARIF